MKLDHFTLISRKPLKVSNIGSIKPIFLHEIEDITIHVYNNFLSILMLDIETYYKWMEKEDDYFRYYSQEQKQKVLDVKKQYEELDAKEKHDRQKIEEEKKVKYNIDVFNKRKIEKDNIKWCTCSFYVCTMYVYAYCVWWWQWW